MGSLRPTSTSTSGTAGIGSYVAHAQRAVSDSVKFFGRDYVVWSGQYEYVQRAAARLKIVVPVTLTIIFLLLYLNFRSITETMVVMLSLPFALIGGLWMICGSGSTCRSQLGSASSHLPVWRRRQGLSC